MFYKGLENGQEVLSHGGFGIPVTYVSSSTPLLLIFATDDIYTYSGFNLSVTGN